MEKYLDEIRYVFGQEKAKAYKQGFTDGMKFVTEPSENIISVAEKAKNHLLSQAADLYGMGKEYKVAKECLEAIIIDLKNAAHLHEPATLEEFWEEEEL